MFSRYVNEWLRVCVIIAAAGGFGWLLFFGIPGGPLWAEDWKGKLVPEQTIDAVLKAHTDRLMSLPGVVGVAQSECAGKPCIKVYVVKRTNQFLKEIPPFIEGFPVSVEESGEIRALDPN